MRMTREELRTFCDMDDFYRFQKRLNRATEADALDILSYLLAEGVEKPGAGPLTDRARRITSRRPHAPAKRYRPGSP